jgi:hypothetical protein
MKNNIFFLFIVAIVGIAGICSADSVSIEEVEGINYLSFISDDNIGISGYNLQLNYSSDINILNLEPVSPYVGAVNIQNEKGFSKIAAFTTEIKGGPSKLAQISYSGSGDIDVLVVELYDENVEPVEITNKVIEPEETPLATPTYTVYSPSEGYVSPGEKGQVSDVPVVVEYKSISSEIPAVTPETPAVPETTSGEMENQSGGDKLIKSIDSGSGIQETEDVVEVDLNSEDKSTEYVEESNYNKAPMGHYMAIIGIFICVCTFHYRRKGKDI